MLPHYFGILLRYTSHRVFRTPVASLWSLFLLSFGNTTLLVTIALTHSYYQQVLCFRDTAELLFLNSVDAGGPVNGVRRGDMDRFGEMSPTVIEAGCAISQNGIVGTSRGRYEALITTTSKNFFDVLGPSLIAGRAYTAANVAENDAGVLTYSAALRVFGTTDALIGRTIDIASKAYIISGILSPSFHFPDTARDGVYVPATADSLLTANSICSGVIRVHSPHARHEAIRRLSVLQQHLHVDGESPYRQLSFAPAETVLTAAGGQPVRMIFAIGLFTFLVAAAGMLTMVLLETTRHRRALHFLIQQGATRRVVIIFSIANQIIACVIAVAISIPLALLIGQVINTRGRVLLPGHVVLRITLPEMAASCGAVSLCCLVAATLTYLLVLRPLFGAEERVNAFRIYKATRRMEQTLYLVAVATVFVVMYHSIPVMIKYKTLADVDLGFNPHNLTVVQVRTTDVARHEPEALIPSFMSLLAQLQAVPGVTAAALITVPPLLREYEAENAITTPSGVCGAAPVKITFATRAVSESFMETLGMSDEAAAATLLAPRAGPAVPVIVNREFIQHCPPLLQHRDMVLAMENGPHVSIAGVIGNIRDYGPISPPHPTLYINYRALNVDAGLAMQLIGVSDSFVIRDAIPLDDIRMSLSDSFKNYNGQILVGTIASYDDVTKEELRDRWTAAMIDGFLLGVVLFQVILMSYGLVTHLVVQTYKTRALMLCFGATQADLILWTGYHLLVPMLGGSIGGLTVIIAETLWHRTALPLRLICSSALWSIGVLAVTAGLGAIEPIIKARHCDLTTLIREE